MSRDRVLRVSAVGLVLYGLLGVLLLALGSILAWQTLSQVERLSTSLGEQQRAMAGVLRQSATSFADAATTFDGFGRTLVEAQQSSSRAATRSRDTAQTMAQLSAAMYVQIFGVQPLVPMAEGFDRAAQQMDALGDDLEAVGTSLGRDVQDVQRAGASLGETRTRLDALARAFGDTPIPSGTAAELRLFRLAIFGLLLWLAGQAFVTIVLGVVLFRWANSRVAMA